MLSTDRFSLDAQCIHPGFPQAWFPASRTSRLVLRVSVRLPSHVVQVDPSKRAPPSLVRADLSSLDMNSHQLPAQVPTLRWASTENNKLAKASTAISKPPGRAGPPDAAGLARSLSHALLRWSLLLSIYSHYTSPQVVSLNTECSFAGGKHGRRIWQRRELERMTYAPHSLRWMLSLGERHFSQQGSVRGNIPQGLSPLKSPVLAPHLPVLSPKAFSPAGLRASAGTAALHQLCMVVGQKAA